MQIDRFSRMAKMAEDSLDSHELPPEAYVYAYGLYSLVDAISALEEAIDDNGKVLKKIESHLHHMGLERWHK